MAQQVQPGHGRSARGSPFRRWHFTEHLSTVLERAKRLRPLLVGEPVVTLTKLRNACWDGIAAGWCQPVSTLPLADVVDVALYAGHVVRHLMWITVRKFGPLFQRAAAPIDVGKVVKQRFSTLILPDPLLSRVIPRPLHRHVVVDQCQWSQGTTRSASSPHRRREGLAPHSCLCLLRKSRPSGEQKDRVVRSHAR